MSVEHLDPSDDARWIADAIERAANDIVEGSLHRLEFPPHPGDGYDSSALCTCGKFQWDADSESDLFNALSTIRDEWTIHVRDTVAG